VNLCGPFPLYPTESSPAACCNDVAFDGYMRIVADKKKDQTNVLKDQLESLDMLNSVAEMQGNSQGSNVIIDQLNNSLSVAESARLLSVCRTVAAPICCAGQPG